MINAKLRYLCAVFFCLMLTGFQINSTAWFRLKLADVYRNNRQYKDAIRIYNKILRKDGVKKHLPEKLSARVSFDLARLYSGLELKNMAIESYARVFAKYADIDVDTHHNGSDLDKDKLLAIGLLEGGRFESAIKELQRLEGRYPDFQDAQKYITTARDLEKSGFTDNENFYFSIGDAYIQNKLFKEARAFYTKRVLDYGIPPMDVLGYLDRKYRDEGGIKEKVWGSHIYVILEDFETIEPQLSVWIRGSRPKVNSHRVTNECAYGGYYSEYLDLTYYAKGPEYWQRTAHVPLYNTKLKLGVRLYVKSAEPSAHTLLFDILYPKQGITGAFPDSEIRDAGGGWQEYRSRDLAASAKSIAQAHNWKTEDMFMDKVVLDTQGISNKFYVDNIELYIIGQSG
jgi:tetratricopeptide (TPR) repeat protein